MPPSSSSKHMNTWQPQHYPLDHRDIPPGAGYQRLVEPSAANGYDGAHTGGVWFHPATPDVIYKPLDGRPHAGADFHCDTREADALTVATGLPGFPPNWWVEEQNGRRWLVRERARPVLDAEGCCTLTEAQVIDLEQGLRGFNGRYWEVSDHLLVLWDHRNRMPFFADLSNAQPMRAGQAHLCANDTDRWLNWLDAHGFTRLAALRRAGQAAISAAHLHAVGLKAWERLDLAWAYHHPAPEGPPLTGLADLLAATIPDPQGGAWVVTDRKVRPPLASQLDLTWAWGPIEYTP